MILKNFGKRNKPSTWFTVGVSALLIAAATLVPCENASAALDLKLKTPYRIDVVLHFSEHRVFTTIFRDRVRRQVRDLLRLQFGELASVDVLEQHPRLSTVLAKGLQQGLDDWHEHGDSQTHFVSLTFRKGEYRIASRLHDGATGLNSPVVSRTQTGDRRLVGPQIVKVIQRQFAPVGAIIETRSNLRMAIQGGAFESAIARWVKPGDVFAVVRMQQKGTAMTGRKMEWALVQTTSLPKNGWCRCRYYNRFPDDELTIGGSTAGYRCLRLATIKSPFRLKLIHADSFLPLSGWEVHVQNPTSNKKPRQLTTNSAGVAETAEQFSTMVIANVVKGKSIWAQLPIEMTSDRIVVCRVKPVEGAEALALWEVRRDGWVNRIYDRLFAASEQLAELNRLIPISLKEALATAQVGSKSLARDVFLFTAQRDRLAVLARQKKLPIQPSDFEDGNQRLQDLEERTKLFDRLAAKLGDAVKQTAAVKELSKELVKARLLENQGAVDQAISIYVRVLKKAPKSAKKVRIHLTALREAWKIRDAAHRNARNFIYKEWSHLKIEDLTEKMALAKKSFLACKATGDRFAIRRMEIVNLAHASRLKSRLNALKQKDTADNRAKAKIIAALAAEFRRLHAEIRMTRTKK